MVLRPQNGGRGQWLFHAPIVLMIEPIVKDSTIR